MQPSADLWLGVGVTQRQNAGRRGFIYDPFASLEAKEGLHERLGYPSQWIRLAAGGNAFGVEENRSFASAYRFPNPDGRFVQPIADAPAPE
jgi:hypothetical protein